MIGTYTLSAGVNVPSALSLEWRSTAKDDAQHRGHGEHEPESRYRQNATRALVRPEHSNDG